MISRGITSDIGKKLASLRLQSLIVSTVVEFWSQQLISLIYTLLRTESGHFRAMKEGLTSRTIKKGRKLNKRCKTFMVFMEEGKTFTRGN